MRGPLAYDFQKELHGKEDQLDRDQPYWPNKRLLFQCLHSTFLLFSIISNIL